MEQHSTELIKKVSYEEGYNDGLKCGKLCAAQQILDDLEDILTQALYQTLKSREKVEPDGNSFIHLTGRVIVYNDLIETLPELRKRYEVQE